MIYKIFSLIGYHSSLFKKYNYLCFISMETIVKSYIVIMKTYLCIIKNSAIFLFFQIRIVFCKTKIFMLGQIKKKNSVYYFNNNHPLGKKKTDIIEECIENSFVKTVKVLIEKNLSKPDYSVRQLSSDLCMDRTNLYRKLTDSIDKPPSQYIRSVRTKYASELIIATDLSLKEISLRAGFRSYSHFIKSFTKERGLTPQEFRKVYNNKYSIISTRPRLQREKKE